MNYHMKKINQFNTVHVILWNYFNFSKYYNFFSFIHFDNFIFWTVISKIFLKIGNLTMKFDKVYRIVFTDFTFTIFLKVSQVALRISAIAIDVRF